MKRNVTFAITAVTLLMTVALPPQLAAQHTRYKLIDLGTFGGPNSTVFVAEDNYDPVLNNRGTITGSADTPATDPFPNFPFSDGFVSHAFQWQNGVMTDLGALEEGVNSASSWISANGLIAGWSENGLIDPFVFPGLGFPESHAVLWKNGKIMDLKTLEGERGYESVALAVNSRAGQRVRHHRRWRHRFQRMQIRMWSGVQGRYKRQGNRASQVRWFAVRRGRSLGGFDLGRGRQPLRHRSPRGSGNYVYISRSMRVKVGCGVVFKLDITGRETILYI
jgi:hypothetical protein